MVSNPQRRHESRRPVPASIRERNDRVLQHIGLAHLAATRQHKRGPECFEDLIQESSLGLIKGIEQFDPNRGGKPSSYLMSRATGQMLHYRRDRARCIRIPWRLRDLFVAGEKLQRQREHAGQPRLSEGDLAQALNVHIQRWQEAVKAHHCQHLLDPCAMEAETPSAPIEDEQLTWLNAVLSQMDNRQHDLLRAHLIEGKTLKQLSDHWQCSRSSLRRQVKDAIETLRQWAKRDGLLLQSCC